MSDSGPKPLSYATSLDELKKLAEVKTSKRLTVMKCKEYMKNLTSKALVARRSKDQELEFICLHRYLIMLSHAVRVLSVSKKDVGWKKEFTVAEDNEKKYGILLDTLKLRYQENLMKTNENTTTDINNVQSKEAINKSKIRKVSDTTENSGEINCFELHKLVKNTSQESFLIMDVRPLGDFETSHINHSNILNVSSDKICPGMSANSLGKKFIDNDSQNLWKKRGDVDKLILLDWSSYLNTLDTKAPLYQLKEILLKWDPGINYKCTPLILKGGYEEVLATYPFITTNPKAKPPSETIPSVTNNSLSTFDYPLDELEEEKAITPTKVVTQKNLVVDRSSKPTSLLNNTILKEININAKDNSDSDSSIISASDPDSVQQINLTDKTSDNVSKVGATNDLETAIKEKNENSSEIISVSSETYDSDPHSPVLNFSRLESPGESPFPPTNKSASSLKQLAELRKCKPNLDKQQEPDNFKNRDALNNLGEGIYTSPLKTDGGSGGLKRSSSSPNIAQMNDDDSVHMKHPTYSRSNKPNRSSVIPAYGERTDSTYGTTSAGLTGLKNFANNCYMNSIVQCLNNTEPLVKEISGMNKGTLNYNSRSKGRVAQEVIDAFRNMWSGEIRTYSIKELKAVMGNIKDIFKGNAHQDSNEFLIILLEHLHEDLNKPAEVTVLDGADVDSGERAWGEFRRKNCSVIQRLFYGQHKSTVTCSTCNHSSATFEQFFNLFVPIPSLTSQTDVTLQDCIQHYMSGERISGWKCPKCNAERNAIKKFDISRLPPILVIALKRFTQEYDSWLQKKENIVFYPLEGLDMSKFTVAGSEQRYTKYNLYAMSIHSGTLKSGHYRAICKNYKSQKWYLFDDQTVEPLQLQSVKNNPEVYILFYNAVPNEK
ncbi:hypothetical protein O3M35_006212 [Rhynocoris fuscipes]|uniref:Ubiquitin carboxyl-terminal hydrolase n=1 Tax=Rhynocoris fuscipes TaxID=488301 RepID=A0AAW1DG78_9HEMI